MKKSLVITLALVFVLGIVGTAFAAANPFVDVPAKHWAYDAVSKLAQAGIVDGYNDGTFRGDKTMTRYEMAQIVAKAMTRSDKANAETKALVDKLAVEFNAELQNLGVRVSKLEANQSNLKFNGQFRVRYTDNDPSVGASAASTQYRLRLDGVAKVDENTTFGMRFVTREPDKGNFANNTWQDFGTNGQGSSDQYLYSNNSGIDRVYFTTKLGEVSATAGRQAFKVDPLDLLMDSAAFSYDGAKFGYKAGKVDLTATYGRFVKGAKYLTANKDDAVTGDAPESQFKQFANLDVAGLTAASKVGKFDYNVGYFQLKNNNYAGNTANAGEIKWTTAYANYAFDKKFSLAAEYVHNGGTKFVSDAQSEDYTTAAKGSNLWALNATYGDQVLAKKGDNQLVAFYMNADANSLFNRFSVLTLTTGNTYKATMDYKLWVADYNYAFSKTMVGTLEYAKADGERANGDITQYRAWVNVKF